ncbi:aminodeoxychorismate/anthranilate synthase component II [Aurantimonas aggregata]|uniref:Aminodeoxychorismate/anthranilate synthase component II n=1 Tax=Aurantimonas aggregata TaxID=2047720 RepID=A0A6L9MK81_9HYPH|nr:aminodeoxychorismate/anthranilate synthase component II [Aurantimonas aggregata]NDV88269.1 aminodeoxychorismate/anthranilate synthase component II [Aurantimonas aggregata]
MILVLDNYDSFVFNVARYVERLGGELTILRNDATTVEALEALSPEAVIISPGPCSPQEAGISLELVRRLSGRLPILGVCLGHQIIGAAFEGTVTRALKPMHGRASTVEHAGTRLFAGFDGPTTVGRYHSLIVEETPAMRAALTVDARSAEGEIMALSHRAHPTYGIQFHPESVLTEDGERIFANFLDLAERWHGRDLA